MGLPWRRRSVLELLEAEHAAVQDRFDHLLRASNEDEQGAAFSALGGSLKVLAQLEEEIFYHEFKLASSSLAQRRLYLQAREEHRAMELLLSELDSVPRGTDTFWAKAKVLQRFLRQHAEQEEVETFAVARAVLQPERLNELGRALRRRRSELKLENKGEGEEMPAGSAGLWLPR